MCRFFLFYRYRDIMKRRIWVTIGCIAAAGALKGAWLFMGKGFKGTDVGRAFVISQEE